jgi:hypothetical protein
LLSDGLLSLVGPDYLIVGQDCLTLVIEDPLHSGLLDCIHKVLVSISDDPLHGLDHLLLQVVQPHLNVEPRAHSVYQFNDLSFRTNQTLDCCWSLLLDVQCAHALKELADVLLDDVHAVGVGKYLHQFIVGNKIKP